MYFWQISSYSTYETLIEVFFIEDIYYYKWWKSENQKINPKNMIYGKIQSNKIVIKKKLLFKGKIF